MKSKLFLIATLAVNMVQSAATPCLNSSFIDSDDELYYETPEEHIEATLGSAADYVQLSGFDKSSEEYKLLNSIYPNWDEKASKGSHRDYNINILLDEIKDKALFSKLMSNDIDAQIYKFLFSFIILNKQFEALTRVDKITIKLADLIHDLDSEMLWKNKMLLDSKFTKDNTLKELNTQLNTFKTLDDLKKTNRETMNAMITSACSHGVFEYQYNNEKKLISKPFTDAISIIQKEKELIDKQFLSVNEKIEWLNKNPKELDAQREYLEKLNAMSPEIFK